MDDLEQYASDKVADNHALNEKLRENKVEIKRLNDLLRHAENYKRYKPLVTELTGIRWKGKKEQFKAEHERDLSQFYMAQRILKEATPDGTQPQED